MMNIHSQNSFMKHNAPKRESIIGKFGTIRKFPIFLKPMLPVLGNWYSIRYMTKIGRQPTLKPIARRKSVGR